MENTLLEFPCDFPMKIIGNHQVNLLNIVGEIILKYVPNFDLQTLQTKLSRNQQYISITCIIKAESQIQLDNLYTELSAHHLIKFVL